MKIIFPCFEESCDRQKTEKGRFPGTQLCRRRCSETNSIIWKKAGKAMGRPAGSSYKLQLVQ